MALVGAGLLNACLGSLFAWSVFVEPLQAEFGWTSREVSSVFSLSLVVFAGMVFASGRLVDRYSPSLLAVVAAVVGGAGVTASAWTASLAWLAVCYGGLFGVANGLGYATAVATASRSPRRGLAVGLVVAAYAVGPLFVGPLAVAVIAATGWRGAFAGFGLGLAGLMLGAALLLRAAPAPAVDDGEASDGEASRVGSPAPLHRRPAAWLLWSVFLFGSAPALMAFAHAATFLGGRGYAPAVAGLAVGGMGIGNAAGRAAAGWISDRAGRLPSLHGSLVLAGLCCAAAGQGLDARLVAAALAGIALAYGAESALVPAATADLFGAGSFGANYGRIFTAWGVAGVLGPLAGAALREGTGNYDLAFRLGVGCTLVALGCSLALARAGRQALSDGPAEAGAPAAK